MKASIFVFILAMLAAASVVAQDKVESPSTTSTTAEAGFDLNYGNDQMVERAIDEPIIDRYASFHPSNGSRSGRCSLSFDLEHEDTDWNFEVTVTLEF